MAACRPRASATIPARKAEQRAELARRYEQRNRSDDISDEVHDEPNAQAAWDIIGWNEERHIGIIPPRWEKGNRFRSLN